MAVAWAYRSGQYAEVCIPAVAHHEWHPLTIASAPHERAVVFFIAVAGGWTAAVAAAVAAGKSAGGTSVVHVRVRGPYGAPCMAAAHFGSLLLVGGGAGVTPMVSLAKAVARERSNAVASIEGGGEVGDAAAADGWPPT